MSRRRILRSECFVNEAIATRARILRDRDDAPLAPSDCSTYDFFVYDLDDDPRTPIYSIEGGAPSEVLSASLRTSGWDEDSTGYNFADVQDAENYPRTGGHTLEHEYVLHTLSEGDCDVVHQVRLIPLWSQ